MRFTEKVVMFPFAGTKVIGNLDNGYTIGLSESGTLLCERLFKENLPAAYIQECDEVLFSHLEKGSFFKPTAGPNTLESAYLHVTHRCNLSCVGCYSYETSRSSLPEPSKEELCRAISQLSKCSVSSLVISGGEPFLRKDLSEILSYSRSETKIGKITVATNGCFVEKGILEPIKHYVDLISVSFDGYSEDSIPYVRKTQLYNRLADAVAAIKSTPIPVQITPTLHRKNYCDINEYVQLAKDLGASLNFSLFSCPPLDSEAAELIPQGEDLAVMGKSIFQQSVISSSSISSAPASTSLSVRSACGAGRSAISISADGSVYPCHMLHEESLLLGNIFTEELNDMIDKNSQGVTGGGAAVDAECSECPYRWLCASGCKARSLYFYADPSRKDPYCLLYRSFFSSFSSYLETMSKGERR